MNSLYEGAARARIANLYSHYAHSLDEGNASQFTSCFAPTGGLWPNTGPFQANKGRFGNDQLAEFVQRSSSGRPRHLILNIDVWQLEETAARTKALFQLMSLSNGQILALGHYEDDLVLLDDRWMFQEKRVSFLWQSEAYLARAKGLPEQDRA